MCRQGSDFCGLSLIAVLLFMKQPGDAPTIVVLHLDGNDSPQPLSNGGRRRYSRAAAAATTHDVQRDCATGAEGRH
jgi:hypothetical protein